MPAITSFSFLSPSSRGPGPNFQAFAKQRLAWTDHRTRAILALLLQHGLATRFRSDVVRFTIPSALRAAYGIWGCFGGVDSCRKGVIRARCDLFTLASRADAAK
ncbi:hypothetical protein IG631_18961 [Alternaria alternata]|nr:hypothetical protein IG631_18961 [Alternaria alternata]